MTIAPTRLLRGGASIPQLGLGTWPLDDAQAARAVASGIERGYRLIDTAENYGNERGVGEGVRQSGLPRDEIVITSKFNRQWHSVDGARTACEASLKRLGVDYLDLLLIHWPNPDQNAYVEAFEGLVALREAGLVRAIGTSNFKQAHLLRLIDAGFVPEVNQIQLDPRHGRGDLLAFHKLHDIATEGWSPLGQGNDLLSHPVLGEIAEAHGRSPAQIALRWQVQQGIIPIPKSADPARQSANLDVFSFALSDEDMATIATLDEGDGGITDSDRFGH
ncbi:aldo/keto reductase [Novosphingobium sp.]|jgi:2,5-diketo-D-gluconate reductase A|uniref:aldo/keto reductase n=1 Tax=Novosphingobium sp. TaxID=1874826 RepID=UPI0031DF547C